MGAWVYRYNPAFKKQTGDRSWTGPLRVVREADGPNIGIQANPESSVRYHHRDMLKIVPAPVPEPMWPAEKPEEEISLVASSIPPRTMVDFNPQNTVMRESESTVIPVIQDATTTSRGTVVSFVLPEVGTSQLAPNHQRSVHKLDRSLPRPLDYKGFRFRDIDHLYLAIMVEKIGGPDRLKAVAKHRSLGTTIRLV